MPGRTVGSSGQGLKVLLALLKAETLELQKELAGGGSGGGDRDRRRRRRRRRLRRQRWRWRLWIRRAGAGGTGGGGGGGLGFKRRLGLGLAALGTGSGSSGSGSGAGTAEAILGTTSTQQVVTVELDATKQSEAVVGEPVTVELPDGTDGRWQDHRGQPCRPEQ